MDVVKLIEKARKFLRYRWGPAYYEGMLDSIHRWEADAAKLLRCHQDQVKPMTHSPQFSQLLDDYRDATDLMTQLVEALEARQSVTGE